MTDDLSSPIAIATASHAKISALFFDKILPLPLNTLDSDIPKEVTLTRPEFNDDLEVTMQEMFKSIANFLRKESEVIVRDRDAVDVSVLTNVWMLRCQEILNENAVSSVPFLLELGSFTRFLPDGHSEALEVKLANIGVIDPSNLEWDQILETRHDSQAITKLRRFRLFMTEKYKAKSESYIKEDLLLRIYDYEQACKKHGLELKQSVIAKILDSKSLLGTLGLTAASVLLGEPLVAGASMLTGTCLEVGKIAVHISQKKLEFESRQNNAEIAYLMDIKGKMEEK